MAACGNQDHDPQNELTSKGFKVFAPGYTVGDLIQWMFPDGTTRLPTSRNSRSFRNKPKNLDAKARWRQPPLWPPDLFAISASLVHLSGCYTEPRFSGWTDNFFEYHVPWLRRAASDYEREGQEFEIPTQLAKAGREAAARFVAEVLPQVGVRATEKQLRDLRRQLAGFIEAALKTHAPRKESVRRDFRSYVLREIGR